MEGYLNMSVSNDDTTGETVTNDQLIAKAISALESDNKADVSLLSVLSEHILKLNPKSTAVNDAVKEIEALSVKRAEEPVDDSADHN